LFVKSNPVFPCEHTAESIQGLCPLFASRNEPLAPEMLQLASIHESLTERFPLSSVYSCRSNPVNATGHAGRTKEMVMDAKYNWLIDNGAVRVTLNVVALALFIATAFGILELATKAS
jgi:hypothetical protein